MCIKCDSCGKEIKVSLNEEKIVEWLGEYSIIKQYFCKEARENMAEYLASKSSELLEIKGE